MRVIFAFLIVLTVAIPFFLGGGCGLQELLKRCTRNSQCRDHQICENKLCVNACKNKICQRGSTCEAENHSASCKCFPGYNYDEKLICRKTCLDNSTCSQSEHCMNYKCVGVCTNNLCRSNEICKNNDDHSYSCICPPGSVRDIDANKCVIGRRSTPACTDDNDCYDTEKCDNGECINVCLTHYQKCNNENEGCLAHDHMAMCICLPQYIRNRRTHECIPFKFYF